MHGTNPTSPQAAPWQQVWWWYCTDPAYQGSQWGIIVLAVKLRPIFCPEVRHIHNSRGLNQIHGQTHMHRSTYTLLSLSFSFSFFLSSHSLSLHSPDLIGFTGLLLHSRGKRGERNYRLQRSLATESEWQTLKADVCCYSLIHTHHKTNTTLVGGKRRALKTTAGNTVENSSCFWPSRQCDCTI